MKLLKAKLIKNSWKLFDENQNLVGERLSGIIVGTNEKLKINDNIYKLKYSGFLWSIFKFFDEDGKLMVMIDGTKDRLFYYGQPFTEMYYLKSKGWSNSGKSLYKFENDELVMKFNYKWSWFTHRYEIEIENGFSNRLLILAFMHYNIRGFED